MVQKNRQALGEKNANSKLSNDEVIEIRTLYETGKYSYNGLSKAYAVSKRHVGSIVNGNYW